MSRGYAAGTRRRIEEEAAVLQDTLPEFGWHALCEQGYWLVSSERDAAGVAYLISRMVHPSDRYAIVASKRFGDREAEIGEFAEFDAPGGDFRMISRESWLRMMACRRDVTAHRWAWAMKELSK